VKSFILGLALVASVFGSAEELKVSGRDYVLSCGYFSSMQGEYDITFKDESLPWGTKVTLISGWDVERWGHPPTYRTWSYREEKEMKSVSPYTWSTRLEAQLHGRTTSEYRQALDMVVKVEVPNQAPKFYNGTSRWGYFQIEVGNTSKAPCVNRDGKKPEFADRLVKVIIKD